MTDDEQLKALKNNKLLSTQIVRAVTSMTKPKNWSDRSYPPYYKEIYGQEMKRFVDPMIAAYKSGDTKNQLVFYYDEWCGVNEEKMKRMTLYLRINQSIRYLIDHMDEHGEYNLWYQSVDVTRPHEIKGVVITYSARAVDVRDGKSPAPVLSEPQRNKPQWLQQIEFWLASANEKPFVKDGLALSEEDMKELEIMFAQVPHILTDITPNAIRLIKMK